MSDVQEIINKLKDMFNKKYTEQEVYDSSYLINKYTKASLREPKSCFNTDRSIRSDRNQDYQAYNYCNSALF